MTVPGLKDVVYLFYLEGVITLEQLEGICRTMDSWVGRPYGVAHEELETLLKAYRGRR